MAIIDLRLGDGLDVMRGIPDDGVDLVFYDPPYNVGKDYGIYKDNLPLEQYESWQQEIAHEARRISRNGIAVYVGSERTLMFWNLLPDAHYIPIHKRAVGVMKGNWFLQYHSLFVTATPLEKCKDLWDDVRLPGEGYYFREQRFDHPGLTAKALVKKILRYFTKEGDTVFDPFLGTGTTAVACFEMNRNCKGTEINPQYYAIAERRIQEAQAQMSMPLEVQ